MHSPGQQHGLAHPLAVDAEQPFARLLRKREHLLQVHGVRDEVELVKVDRLLLLLAAQLGGQDGRVQRALLDLKKVGVLDG